MTLSSRRLSRMNLAWLLSWARLLTLTLISTASGCGALKQARDEIIGVKPALERCFENRDHVTPAWIPIPHLACRGGTPRHPEKERTEKPSWPPDWLVSHRSTDPARAVMAR